MIMQINKIIKTEFISQNRFKTLEELKLGLAEYVYSYNNIKIYGSIGYNTLIDHRDKLRVDMIT